MPAKPLPPARKEGELKDYTQIAAKRARETEDNLVKDGPIQLMKLELWNPPPSIVRLDSLIERPADEKQRPSAKVKGSIADTILTGRLDAPIEGKVDSKLASIAGLVAGLEAATRGEIKPERPAKTERSAKSDASAEGGDGDKDEDVSPLAAATAGLKASIGSSKASATRQTVALPTAPAIDTSKSDQPLRIPKLGGASPALMNRLKKVLEVSRQRELPAQGKGSGVAPYTFEPEEQNRIKKIGGTKLSLSAIAGHYAYPYNTGAVEPRQTYGGSEEERLFHVKLMEPDKRAAAAALVAAVAAANSSSSSGSGGGAGHHAAPAAEGGEHHSHSLTSPSLSGPNRSSSSSTAAGGKSQWLSPRSPSKGVESSPSPSQPDQGDSGASGSGRGKGGIKRTSSMKAAGIGSSSSNPPPLYASFGSPGGASGDDASSASSFSASALSPGGGPAVVGYDKLIDATSSADDKDGGDQDQDAEASLRVKFAVATAVTTVGSGRNGNNTLRGASGSSLDLRTSSQNAVGTGFGLSGLGLRRRSAWIDAAHTVPRVDYDDILEASKPMVVTVETFKKERKERGRRDFEEVDEDSEEEKERRDREIRASLGLGPPPSSADEERKKEEEKDKGEAKESMAKKLTALVNAPEPFYLSVRLGASKYGAATTLHDRFWTAQREVFEQPGPLLSVQDNDIRTMQADFVVKMPLAKLWRVDFKDEDLPGDDIKLELVDAEAESRKRKRRIKRRERRRRQAEGKDDGSRAGSPSRSQSRARSRSKGGRKSRSPHKRPASSSPLRPDPMTARSISSRTSNGSGGNRGHSPRARRSTSAGRRGFGGNRGSNTGRWSDLDATETDTTRDSSDTDDDEDEDGSSKKGKKRNGADDSAGANGFTAFRLGSSWVKSRKVKSSDFLLEGDRMKLSLSKMQRIQEMKRTKKDLEEAKALILSDAVAKVCASLAQLVYWTVMRPRYQALASALFECGSDSEAILEGITEAGYVRYKFEPPDNSQDGSGAVEESLNNTLAMYNRLIEEGIISESVDREEKQGKLGHDLAPVFAAQAKAAIAAASGESGGSGSGTASSSVTDAHSGSKPGTPAGPLARSGTAASGTRRSLFSRQQQPRVRKGPPMLYLPEGDRQKMLASILTDFNNLEMLMDARVSNGHRRMRPLLLLAVRSITEAYLRLQFPLHFLMEVAISEFIRKFVPKTDLQLYSAALGATIRARANLSMMQSGPQMPWQSWRGTQPILKPIGSGSGSAAASNNNNSSVMMTSLHHNGALMPSNGGAVSFASADEAPAVNRANRSPSQLTNSNSSSAVASQQPSGLLTPANGSGSLVLAGDAGHAGHAGSQQQQLQSQQHQHQSQSQTSSAAPRNDKLAAVFRTEMITAVIMESVLTWVPTVTMLDSIVAATLDATRFGSHVPAIESSMEAIKAMKAAKKEMARQALVGKLIKATAAALASEEKAQARAMAAEAALMKEAEAQRQAYLASGFHLLQPGWDDPPPEVVAEVEANDSFRIAAENTKAAAALEAAAIASQLSTATNSISMGLLSDGSTTSADQQSLLVSIAEDANNKNMLQPTPSKRSPVASAQVSQKPSVVSSHNSSQVLPPVGPVNSRYSVASSTSPSKKGSLVLSEGPSMVAPAGSIHGPIASAAIGGVTAAALNAAASVGGNLGNRLSIVANGTGASGGSSANDGPVEMVVAFVNAPNSLALSLSVASEGGPIGIDDTSPTARSAGLQEAELSSAEISTVSAPVSFASSAAPPTATAPVAASTASAAPGTTPGTATSTAKRPLSARVRGLASVAASVEGGVGADDDSTTVAAAATGSSIVWQPRRLSKADNTALPIAPLLEEGSSSSASSAASSQGHDGAVGHGHISSAGQVSLNVSSVGSGVDFYLSQDAPLTLTASLASSSQQQQLLGQGSRSRPTSARTSSRPNSARSRSPKEGSRPASAKSRPTSARGEQAVTAGTQRPASARSAAKAEPTSATTGPHDEQKEQEEDDIEFLAYLEEQSHNSSQHTALIQQQGQGQGQEEGYGEGFGDGQDQFQYDDGQQPQEYYFQPPPWMQKQQLLRALYQQHLSMRQDQIAVAVASGYVDWRHATRIAAEEVAEELKEAARRGEKARVSPFDNATSGVHVMGQAGDEDPVTQFRDTALHAAALLSRRKAAVGAAFADDEGGIGADIGGGGFASRGRLGSDTSAVANDDGGFAGSASPSAGQSLEDIVVTTTATTMMMTATNARPGSRPGSANKSSSRPPSAGVRGLGGTSSVSAPTSVLVPIIPYRSKPSDVFKMTSPLLQSVYRDSDAVETRKFIRQGVGAASSGGGMAPRPVVPEAALKPLGAAAGVEVPEEDPTGVKAAIKDAKSKMNKRREGGGGDDNGEGRQPRSPSSPPSPTTTISPPATPHAATANKKPLSSAGIMAAGGPAAAAAANIIMMIAGGGGGGGTGSASQAAPTTPLKGNVSASASHSHNGSSSIGLGASILPWSPLVEKTAPKPIPNALQDGLKAFLGSTQGGPASLPLPASLVPPTKSPKYYRARMYQPGDNSASMPIPSTPNNAPVVVAQRKPPGAVGGASIGIRWSSTSSSSSAYPHPQASQTFATLPGDKPPAHGGSTNKSLAALSAAAPNLALTGGASNAHLAASPFSSSSSSYDGTQQQQVSLLDITDSTVKASIYKSMMQRLVHRYLQVERVRLSPELKEALLFVAGITPPIPEGVPKTIKRSRLVIPREEQLLKAFQKATDENNPLDPDLWMLLTGQPMQVLEENAGRDAEQERLLRLEDVKNEIASSLDAMHKSVAMAPSPFRWSDIKKRSQDPQLRAQAREAAVNMRVHHEEDDLIPQDDEQANGAAGTQGSGDATEAAIEGAIAAGKKSRAGSAGSRGSGGTRPGSANSTFLVGGGSRPASGKLGRAGSGKGERPTSASNFVLSDLSQAAKLGASGGAAASLGASRATSAGRTRPGSALGRIAAMTGANNTSMAAAAGDAIASLLSEAAGTAADAIALAGGQDNVIQAAGEPEKPAVIVISGWKTSPKKKMKLKPTGEYLTNQTSRATSAGTHRPGSAGLYSIDFSKFLGSGNNNGEDQDGSGRADDSERTDDSELAQAVHEGLTAKPPSRGSLYKVALTREGLGLPPENPYLARVKDRIIHGFPNGVIPQSPRNPLMFARGGQTVGRGGFGALKSPGGFSARSAVGVLASPPMSPGFVPPQLPAAAGGSTGGSIKGSPQSDHGFQLQRRASEGGPEGFTLDQPPPA